jgi:hypothetical protein
MNRDLTGLRFKDALERLDSVRYDVAAIAKLFPKGFNGQPVPAGKKPNGVA